jgi:tRNA-2-methylthio-N6-dimethylallyladenosine synthase
MKYHIITYGCQMNKNDSERAVALLNSVGWEVADEPKNSDFILINTCSIRESAESHVYGQMHNFSKLRTANPNLLLGVTGCMPGRDRDGVLRKRLPMVDLFFPIADLPQLPRWLAEHFPATVNTSEPSTDYFRITPQYAHNAKGEVKQAFVSISSGCNNFCTFCVVPYSRGRERSRTIQSVLDECRELVAHGCLEITLLGQNVNTYKPTDKESLRPDNPYTDFFAALLWELNQLDGLARIHFTAPNPQDMSDEVIHALGLPKHVNYLHLPVQAGSNRVLKKMNRRYTREKYLEIIDKVKKVRPTMAIGTDIIVGFCSETEEEFMETVDLYIKSDFDISYTAMYSVRSGTLSAKLWEDDVPREEKKRRWEYLQKIMEENVLRKNQRFIDQTLPVLVERAEEGFVPGLGRVNWLFGKSLEQKIVQFLGDDDLIGTIQPVKISEAKEWFLRGTRQT